ncbi:MAG: hypothetical protein Q7R43_00825 [Candidatus Daviesbacteria bacterium]|nr:hypothetical protein [Candidatus Daviesbacteria bacterium]
MTVEQKHYIFGLLRVRVKEIPVGKTIHLRTIFDPESDTLGYPNLAGEAIAESLTVRQPDLVSINRYNPNRGLMNEGIIKYLQEEHINKAKLIADIGCCLGSLIGYRSRISWKPTKTK